MSHQETGNGLGKNYIVSKIFIDTNIFVYTVDKKEDIKQKKARKILKKIVEIHQPVISTQIIKEFYVVAINKLRADHFIVKNIIHNFKNMEVVNNDLELIEQAIDISVILQITFWDALVVAAAEKANCEFIFSEDLNPGQTYRGVLVINPFEKDDF